MQNPLAAKEKIENETQNGRIAGPFEMLLLYPCLQ
jgi:hypothetical protein